MNAAVFLVDTIFHLYLLVVMLRFLLQVMRADFYNPLSQFVVKATNPPLVFLRRFIPGFGGIDISAIFLMLIIQIAAIYAVSAVLGAIPPFLAVLPIAFVKLILLALDIFFFMILVQVILSWVNPGGYNPVIGVLTSLTEPLLGPVRRRLPPIGGFDLSPMVVLIGLKVVSLLIIDIFVGLTGINSQLL